MTIFPLSPRKTLASALAAALVVSAPGPLAVDAAAQAFAASASRAAVGGTGAVAASAGTMSLSAPRTLAPALNAPAAFAAPSLGFAAAPSFAPALAPAVAPAASPAAVPTALPTAAPALSAAPSAAPAAAPESALAAGRELNSRLEAAAKPGADASLAEKALNAFFGGVESAAPCIFADMARRAKGEGLKPSDASAAAPSNGQPPAPRVSPSSRFKPNPIHLAAMRAMAAIWSVWDRAIDHRWDKLPTTLGELYLYMNEQSLRLHVWDANAQPSTDKTAYPPATEAQKNGRSADGSYFDDQDPGMAKAGTRFNQLREPAGPPRADWATMDPNPLVISEKLAKRAVGADGEPVIKEAGILNDLSAGHIQFNVHDWENHERQSIARDPLKFPLPAGHPLAADGSKEMTLDRTAKDETLPVGYAGAPTHRNMETSAWDMSMIYGSSLERQKQVRAGVDGKLKIGADGRLLDDPEKPGVPLTGFNDNMSPQLIVMHTIWTLEHNSVADAVKSEHPDWNDEQIFQMARLRVTALNARLHTTEWTRALLPNRILHAGMWHDWYGFVDKPLKLWIMRFTDRHPRLGRILFAPLRNELAFGVPGTKTQHFGKHYAFVEEFPDVYRLHTMLRDLYQMQRLETNPDGTVEVRLMKKMRLEDMIGYKSRDTMAQFPMEDWTLTFLNESAGALTINNAPNALRNLTTQDGRKIDLSAVDIIRTRERLEANTYVKFTVRLGEKPPKTFLELTGGDEKAAALLAEVYKSVDDVDFQIGILAERKPDAFALGNRQFKVFVLSAPARLKNDRLLSEQYGSQTYGASGIEYVEHTNFAQILERHYPSLRPAIEGVENMFAPLPKAGTLVDRLGANATASSDASLKATLRASTVSVYVATAALLLGWASWPIVVALFAAAIAARVGTFESALSGVERAAGVLRAYRDGAREAELGNLFAAEKAGRRGALFAKIGAFALLDVGGTIAWHLFAAHPLIALILGAASIWSGLKALRAAKTASADLTNLRVGLAAKLTEGREHVDPATLPGETSLQKRYWVMLGAKPGETPSPFLSMSDTYGVLRRSGLPVAKAFMTAAMWHVPFARKTWVNYPEEKARYKPGFLDIWIPGLIDTQGYSNNRVFGDGTKPGVAKGDLDMAEFDRLFRDFGMHDYLTAYDLARIREANQHRDAVAGRGNWLSRAVGRYAAKRRADQLIELFADRVVWEDGLHGRLVPAISREQFLRFYRGGLHYEVLRDRATPSTPAK